MDEEVEIKIEYYELFDSDPLSENTESIEQCETEENVSDSNDLQNKVQVNTATSEKTTWYKSIDKAGRYLCRFCELPYHTIYTLRRHITTKHDDQANTLKDIILNNKRNKKIKCHICKTRFKTLSELQCHVEKDHDLTNSLSCKICKAKFVNNDEKCHHLQLKHNVVTTISYRCDLCGYETSKKSHFKQHNNTHTENNKRKCKFCDYATNYPPNLTIHERIHTKVMAYSCSFDGCGYKCVAKSALRSHQLKHEPEKHMLYCDKCSYKTVYKQSLRKHMDSHNRNSVRLRINL